ncbi:MAG: hypothetical protein IH586_01465 [Anaerolineaceae bacterium]|nr:hypothetical protein [Anaerolineaceae bacterium]
MIQITENGLLIETSTTRVRFSGSRLVSIQDSTTHEKFLDPALAKDIPGFELFHQNGKSSSLGTHSLASQVHTTLLTGRIAEIVLNDWECDVSIRVSIDEETGDVLLEPSAWTMQGGIAGLGMNISGIRTDLEVVGPFQQGVKAPLSHAQVQGKSAGWPFDWEAGFLIFAGKDSGFTVQTWDESFIPKGVTLGREQAPQSVGFITYTRGPLESSHCAGNLCWRISAYRGNWQMPVLRYRDWYWKAYHLEDAARLRPEWLDNLKLAVSWCPTNLNLLDSLAKKVDPHQVFLHLPHWRPYGYDQDYPTYVAEMEGAAFIAKAREMGYHVAPHANACQMSPDHPFFFQARDFCTRGPQDLRWGGWSWLPVEGWGSFGPPQSYSLMPAHKDWNVLVNVHLAWSPWRRQLTRQVANLVREHDLDSIFVDVSQLIQNSDNAMLENLTYAQGSLKLIRELAEIAPGLCVSGESRNEISTQYLSVEQFHLFNFAHTRAIDGADVSWVGEITAPVNEILFKGLARGIGYNYGMGNNRLPMIDATLKQGAIPTLILETSDPVSELEGKEAQYILEHMVA